MDFIQEKPKKSEDLFWEEEGRLTLFSFLSGSAFTLGAISFFWAIKFIYEQDVFPLITHSVFTIIMAALVYYLMKYKVILSKRI